MFHRFKCPTCPVTCQGLAGLQEHLRIHTGERPFSCKECSATFKRIQTLKKHVRNVHHGPGATSHPCSSCKMVFNNRGNLLRHYLRKHVDLRRFICGLCGSQYGQNQDLKRHLKVKHHLEMPVISFPHKKSANEIYVLPAIDKIPESHPHAEKINKIVAAEKEKLLKFNIFTSDSKTRNTSDSSVDISPSALLPTHVLQPSLSLLSVPVPPSSCPAYTTPLPIQPQPPPPSPQTPSPPPLLPSPVKPNVLTLYRCGFCFADFLDGALLTHHIEYDHKETPAVQSVKITEVPSSPFEPQVPENSPVTEPVKNTISEENSYK